MDLSPTQPDVMLDAYRRALSKPYAAYLTDIDGTITPPGIPDISDFLFDEIARVAGQVPFGVCTAQNLERSLLKFAPAFDRARTLGFDLRSSLILLCENGSLGYFFNPKTQRHEEWYRVPFPFSEPEKQSLFSELADACGELLGTSLLNELSLIYRPPPEKDPRILAEKSRALALRLLEKMDSLGLRNNLEIGDSGIGVTIFPREGNKDRGTKEFAEFLYRQGKISEVARENAAGIVVVGNRPDPLGNDEFFLDGRNGTPFSVGELHPNRPLPLPVFDHRGTLLDGPAASLELLKTLIFLPSSHE